jgi:DNA-binding CsgD family transcriptional regulator
MSYAQGDSAQVSSLVRQLLPAGPAEEPGCTFHFDALWLQRLAATVALDAGDLPLARAWLEAHDRWLAWKGAIRGRVQGALGWAAYYRAADAGDVAAEHARRGLAHATEPRQPLALLAAHRVLGELAANAGQYLDAAAHLDSALALADACAAPYERALTLLALAGLRLSEGRREVVGELLAETRKILAGLQALPALAVCDALTARLDAPVAAGSGPERVALPEQTSARLTAREIEVLRLVAAGASNREMAAALCRSERTIERHLENIYRKIDARNRADATAFALRHHLA